MRFPMALINNCPILGFDIRSYYPRWYYLDKANMHKLATCHEQKHQPIKFRDTDMVVSEVIGVPPVIIHWGIHHKPTSELGVPPWLWNPPYNTFSNSTIWLWLTVRHGKSTPCYEQFGTPLFRSIRAIGSPWWTVNVIARGWRIRLSSPWKPLESGPLDDLPHINMLVT